jgi:hypothetical protein
MREGQSTLDDVGTIEPTYPLPPLREVSSGVLSEVAGYRLLVEGPYTAKEIGVLINYLKVVREALNV